MVNSVEKVVDGIFEQGGRIESLRVIRPAATNSIGGKEIGVPLNLLKILPSLKVYKAQRGSQVAFIITLTDIALVKEPKLFQEPGFFYEGNGVEDVAIGGTTRLRKRLLT